MTYEPSRRLTSDDKVAMKASINRLIGRHIQSIPDWGHPEHFVKLYRACLPDVTRDFFDAACAWYSKLGKSPPGVSEEGTMGFRLALPSDRTVILQVVQETLNAQGCPLLDLSADPEALTVNVADTIGIEAAHQFEEWATVCCTVQARAARSADTADNIINMVGTVGQLHRCVPDLVKYTYPSHMEALKAQVRRSPVPGEWMEIKREHAHDLVNHLALCYLLEPTAAAYPCILPHRDWVFTKGTLITASYSTYAARFCRDCVCGGLRW